MRNVLLSICLCVLLLGGIASAEEVAQHLQDVSVTIRTNYSQGSGVIVTRMDGGKRINFVWTAAHVVEDLRKVESVVTADGATRKVVSFADCSLVKELIEGGRRVGEMKMDAVVVKYSEKEDLALLRIRKVDFISTSALFYLEEEIPKIGSGLFHVGSLLGQAGSNSMTTGIVSQIGRVYPSIGKEVFDQTTVTAFPGSSGGGVYLEDGRYVGMLVRGAGETFNLIVPVRRMYRWATAAGIAWAMDDSLECPTLEDIDSIPVECVGHSFQKPKSNSKKYPYLLHINGDIPDGVDATRQNLD